MIGFLAKTGLYSICLLILYLMWRFGEYRFSKKDGNKDYKFDKDDDD